MASPCCPRRRCKKEEEGARVADDDDDDGGDQVKTQGVMHLLLCHLCVNIYSWVTILFTVTR